MTIYVVTAGFDDSCSIETICSTKEIAQDYIVKHCLAYGYSINDYLVQEYYLDEFANSIVREFWRASIDLLSGRLDIWGNQPDKMLTDSDENYICEESEDYKGNKQCYIRSFVSIEHAKKVCIEKYQEHLRCSTKSDTIQNNEN